jgi:hypothetical protein
MLRLFLALVAFLVLVHIAYGGNCSLATTLTLETDVVRFDVAGYKVTASAISQGHAVGNNTFAWELGMLVERLKTPSILNDTLLIAYRCIMPRLDLNEFFSVLTGGAILDPLEPKVTGQVCTGFSKELLPGSLTCGEVVSYFSPDDLDCYAEEVEDVLGGFKRSSINVHFTHPLHPDFNLVTSYMLLDGDLDYAYNHRFGGQHLIEYRYGSP